MTAAISLFVVLTLSVFVIRVSAVALRLTGLPEDTARFQARSAFTGTGFTTSDSESIVNHPLRRRIISLLMLAGNLGLITVVSTVIVSLVNTKTSAGTSMDQFLWILAALVVLWFVALNPLADRVMCNAIGRLLRKQALFSANKPAVLLQLPAGYSVCEFRFGDERSQANRSVADFAADGVTVLGVRRPDGSFVSLPDDAEQLSTSDEIIAYGSVHALGSVGRGFVNIQGENNPAG